MRTRSRVASGLMLALASALLVGAKAPIQVGDVAPPFELTLIDGSKVSSEQLRGQVVVLNFWATWCGPCKRELPLLDGYYTMQKQHGLKVYAIATEDSLQIFELRKLFAVMHLTPARKIKGPYPVLGGVPTNYIIDRSGHVRFAKAAALDIDDMNTLLVPLLREPAPPELAAPAKIAATPKMAAPQG